MNPSNPNNGGKWSAFQNLGYDVKSDSGRAFGANDVISQVRSQLPKTQATPNGTSPFGPRVEVDVSITGPNGSTGTLVTIWQYDNGSAVPRLITNYLKVHS
jgi:hypothetical protein